MNTSNLSLIIVMLLAFASSLQANAMAKNLEGIWFLHEFGELRAYHGDFLNVCDGQSFGNCRTVQYGFNGDEADGFFGARRLSIARTEGGESAGGGDLRQYSIEIFIRDLQDVPQGPFTLSIDGEVFQLKDSDWQTGSPEGYNVSETFSIINPALINQLIAKMRTGNRLRILYDGYKETHFQLRGFTSALDAIEMQVENAMTQ